MGYGFVGSQDGAVLMPKDGRCAVCPSLHRDRAQWRGKWGFQSSHRGRVDYGYPCQCPRVAVVLEDQGKLSRPAAEFDDRSDVSSRSGWMVRPAPPRVPAPRRPPGPGRRCLCSFVTPLIPSSRLLSWLSSTQVLFGFLTLSLLITVSNKTSL